MVETKAGPVHTQAPDPSSKWSHSREIFTAVGAIIGAVGSALALILLVISPQAQERAEAQDKNKDLSNTVESQRTTIGELENQVAAQEEEIGRLRAAPTTSDGPSGDDELAVPAIRREGQLDVNTESRPADLDAPALDAQWGRAGNTSASNEELQGFLLAGVYPGRFTFGYGSQFIVVDGAADYNVCRDATGYRGPNLDVTTLSEGSNICVLTDQERFALLTVRSVSMDALGLEVTVWEKDGG